jgi:hypothetical protein
MEEENYKAFERVSAEIAKAYIQGGMHMLDDLEEAARDFFEIIGQYPALTPELIQGVKKQNAKSDLAFLENAKKMAEEYKDK